MMTLSRITCISILVVCCATCTGGGIDISIDPPPPPPAQPQVTVEGQIKQLVFSWSAVPGADHYRLMENADGHSGFTQVGNNIPSGTLIVSRDIAVHLFDWVNAQYIVEACNVTGCASSDVVTATNVMLDVIGYFKASNPGAGDRFGTVALSQNGTTLAVGAAFEDSKSTGVNGDQDDNSAYDSGAVYIFRSDGTNWYQEAYVKGSLGWSEYIHFGWVVALSADGTTLAVGGLEECGAYAEAYIFRFDGSGWYQEAFFGTSWDDIAYFECGRFKHDLALSADGNTLAIGAPFESANKGAAYVYHFDGTEWLLQAYIERPPHLAGTPWQFAESVALSADSMILAIGETGAVHIYGFDGTEWLPQSYIQAYGASIALSADGRTLAAGRNVLVFNGTDWSQQAQLEAGGNPVALSADGTTIATTGGLVFGFDGVNWSQQAHVEAPNADSSDRFGQRNSGRYPHRVVALSADGTMLAIGALMEDSGAAGVNGDQRDDSVNDAGAAYVY